MILHRLEINGVSTAFPGTVAIDFDRLGPGLIAFVGDNGHGKSHAIELSGPGTFYRQFPSYSGDPFASHIHPAAEIAESKLTFEVGGCLYQLEVTYDAGAKGGKGQTRAKLFRDAELIAGPERLGDVDAILATLIPSQEVMLASSFACQSRDGSFGDLPKARKKELFMELLGLARLEVLAEVAKTKRQRAETALDTLRPQVEQLRVKAERYAELWREIEEKSARVDELTDQLEIARADQTVFVEALEGAREQLQRLEQKAETYGERKQQLNDTADTARDDKRRARQAIDDNRVRLADEAAVTEAHEKCQSIDAQLTELTRQVEDATEKLRPVETDLASLQERRSSLVADYKRLAQDLQIAEAAETKLAESSTDPVELQAKIDQRREEKQAARDAVAAEAKLTEYYEKDVENETAAAARVKHLRESKEKIEKQVGMLEGVDLAHPMCGACPLTVHTRTEMESLRDIEQELEELTIEGTPARDTLREHRAELARLRGLDEAATEALAAAERAMAEIAGDVEKAGKAPELRELVAANKTDGQSVRGRIDALEGQKQQIQTALDGHQRTRTDLETQKAPLVGLAGQFAAVTAARAQQDQLEQNLKSAAARYEKAMNAFAELGDAPDLEPARLAVDNAQGLVNAANDRITGIQAELTPISEALQRLIGEKNGLGDDPLPELARTKSLVDETTQSAADWSQLEKAFGKDGIQALEIDAAGPTVTAIANDLLTSCYGSRFQLRIDTTEPTQKGDKVKEIFDVKILDAEAPEGERRCGSGGEQAILDEALRLAIAIFNTQRSGHETLTLWRDETGGALSPENASRYVHMLRRAREIGGFHQVLFISHSEAVWAQADRQLFFADGEISETPIARAA